MLEEVFVLGCPGSGKSTAANYILELLKSQPEKQNVYRISDYEMLFDWSRHPLYKEDFRKTEYGGFDVCNPSIYNDAIREVKDKIQSHMAHSEDGFIIIDFARYDYQKSFDLLQEFIQNAYFLFVDADIKTCKERVRQRVLNQITLDNHYVSNHVLALYQTNENYIKDNVSLLKQNYGIKDDRIQIINNSSSTTLNSFREEIKQIVTSVIKPRLLVLQEA